MLQWLRYPLAAALAVLPMAATAALPTSAPRLAKAAAGGLTHEVEFRHHDGFGRGLGVGLGIGILGAIMAREVYGPHPAYEEAPSGATAEDGGDPRHWCAQHFRSFEWNSGLYTTPSGEKRVCPYLR